GRKNSFEYRQILEMQFLCLFYIAIKIGIDHLTNLRSYDMAGDADNTTGADRKKWKSQIVVSGIDSKIRVCSPSDLCHLIDVSAGFLYRMNRRYLSSHPGHGISIYVDTSSSWNVINDYGNGCLASYGLHMRFDSF